MVTPLLQRQLLLLHTQHTQSSVLPTCWALPFPVPLIPVSPGQLWNRAEAKNTFSLSNFIFRCSPEGAMSELLVFAWRLTQAELMPR